MAKKNSSKVMLVNKEHNTATKYMIMVPNKGTKASTKIELRKYDPVLRQHCIFTQKKLPSPK